MKNLKISKKLFLSFAVVLVMAVILAITALLSMSSLSNETVQNYHTVTHPLDEMVRFSVAYGNVRSHMRDLGRFTLDEDIARQVAAIETNLNASIYHLQQYYDAFAAHMHGSTEYQLAASLLGAMEDYAAVVRNSMIPAGVANENERVFEILSEDLAPIGAAIRVNMDELATMKSVEGEGGVLRARESLQSSIVTTVVILTVAVALSIAIAMYLSSLIGKPLKILSAWMGNAATTGEIVMTDEERANIERLGTVKDEIGETAKFIGEFIFELVSVTKELDAIASGDLTHKINMVSEKDTIGRSLTKVVDNLNNMFDEINTATHQVYTGSKQIADAAQSLAQGSTEQAASVQQLSSSIAEIAQKTKGNAEMAEKAAMLANDIKDSAEKGNRQMDEMMNAVKNINESSHNISKVIKSIDDIAFQTNILALNAAVEAARAGQHGKGFAVVAEEVRNLAAKSAAAAKDTESLIADSIEKAELGSKIADETAASLVEIVAGIGESNELVSEIAKSSEEQSAGIAQINTGVDQVAQVVQQNSATAQQSAAASQEMSGQSTILEGLIAQFKLKGSARFGQMSAPTAKILPAPTLAEAGGSFGKY